MLCRWIIFVTTVPTNLKRFRCAVDSSNAIKLLTPISNNHALVSFLNEAVAMISAFYNKTKGDRVACEGLFLRSSAELVFSSSCYLDLAHLKCCRCLSQQSKIVTQRALTSSTSKRKAFVRFLVLSQAPLKWCFSASLRITLVLASLLLLLVMRSKFYLHLRCTGQLSAYVMVFATFFLPKVSLFSLPFLPCGPRTCYGARDHFSCLH